MIELTLDQKHWLNALLGLDEDVKREIVSTLKVCASSSVMHDEFHPKYAQYLNGINAVNKLLQHTNQTRHSTKKNGRAKYSKKGW